MKKKKKVRTCGNCAFIRKLEKEGTYSLTGYYCIRLDTYNFLSYYRPSIPVVFECHRFNSELNNPSPEFVEAVKDIIKHFYNYEEEGNINNYLTNKENG